MSKTLKRAAVVTLAGVMTMGMLAGCGEKKLDGSQTVATVNGTEIPMGVLSLMVRQDQAMTEAMYAQFMGQEYAIWSTEAEEGVTYGQQMVQQSLEQLELMYLMKEKAADYGVEVTEEDQNAIAEAAASFMKANSQETIEKLSVTEDQVKTLLELKTYEARMYDPMVADVDTEISDEESQQTTFSYVSVSTADLEEKEVQKKKEEAQKILDAVKAAPDADFAETVASVGEEYSAVDGSFDTNEPEPAEGEEDEVYASSSYPEEVISVLKTLKDGEIGPEVIETDTSYYVVKLNAKVDEAATQEKKDSILQERKSELYTDTSEAWKEEAEITENEEVLKALTVKDNEKYKIVMPEAEETEEQALEPTDEIADETGMDEEITQDEVLVPVEDEAETTDDAAAESETADDTTSEEETEAEE